jgi:asparagine synthase (glutamine-hydrolysing)
MCGIAGTAGFVPAEAARQGALSAMRDRGPDGAREWQSAAPPVWFGHRRLAIIDIGHDGDQPMALADRPDVVIIFNGEIYNYRSVRAELEALGRRFVTASDTEVLLQAYATWGDDFLDRIEGMFAFALFDGGKRTITLARDPVGQKPLYYRQLGSRLIFASTAEALRRLDPTIGALSATALCYVLSLGYVPAPHSMWDGVHCVKPGHRLTWSETGEMREERYWAPPTVIGDTNADADAFAALFDTVCLEHTVSDVPVGLFLSGGIDSSAVGAALSKAGKPLHSYTLGFANSRNSEHAIAAETARHLGLPATELRIERVAVDDLRHAVARAVPEPQGYSALLTMYAIAERAAGAMKVMLSGDGGDELFGGYGWYVPPNRFLAPFAEHLRAAFGPGHATRGAIAKFAHRSPLHAHAMRVFHRFLPEEAAAVFAPLAPRFDEETMLAPLAEHYLPDWPRQRALQRVDLMTFCSGSVLAKVDRMAMAHSLEVRAPFLDRRVIDWALTRQPEPLKRGQGKPLLRRYLAGRVPASVLTHAKQGFSLRGLSTYDWRGLADEVVHSRMARDGLLSPGLAAHLDPVSTVGQSRLWALASVTAWYEHHAGAPSS